MLYTLATIIAVSAPKPLPTERMARVDVIVINRHRMRRVVEYEDWRGQTKTRIEYSEAWWVSFWEFRIVRIPGVAAVVCLTVDRGWWSVSSIGTVSRCSGGWCVTRRQGPHCSGLSVIGRELWTVDSPFDFEVENRWIYRPIR